MQEMEVVDAGRNIVWALIHQTWLEAAVSEVTAFNIDFVNECLYFSKCNE